MTITLIRHGEVEPRWRKICYGALDVPLSASGLAASQRLAQELANTLRPTLVFHSDLSRTRTLADFIAHASSPSVKVVADRRLRERNYGQWQGVSWEEAYASDPEHFQDLIEKPDSYRPPGGETTSEMQLRVVQWHQETARSCAGETIVAISHSGPIAALAGRLHQAHARDWSPWMVKPLQSWEVPRTSLELPAG